MNIKFLAISLLSAMVVLTGCQSGNISHSRNSEAGRAIAGLDDEKRQHLKNVETYRQAMTNYEKAHGDTCGRIMFSSIVGPMETPEPRVQICKLQGSSRGCGYQNYKAKITFADDACHIVKTVEILERMKQ